MSGGRPELQPLGSEPQQKACAVCGEKFCCGAPEPGCWCEEVQIAREVLRELRARYLDCLCRRCLCAAAAGGTTRADSPPAARNNLPTNLP
jgi:Cysteine-rich CWC